MCSGDGGLKGALHSRGKQTSVAYSAGKLEPEQVPPMLINGLFFLSAASLSCSPTVSQTQLDQKVFGQESHPVEGSKFRLWPLRYKKMNAVTPFY